MGQSWSIFGKLCYTVPSTNQISIHSGKTTLGPGATKISISIVVVYPVSV